MSSSTEGTAAPPAPATRDLRKPSPLAAQGWLALSALLFGAMATATRAAASTGLSGAQVATVRFLLGLLGVLAVVATGNATLKPTRWGFLVLRGVFGGLAVLGYFLSIERLGAGPATLLNYTFPLWAAVIAYFVLGEKLSFRLVVGFTLATVGLVVAFGTDRLADLWRGLGDPVARLGLGAGLLSSLFGGAATVMVRAARKTDSALVIFVAFCVGGLVVCAPLAALDWRPISAGAVPLLFLVGAFSFGAQFLFTWALRFVTVGAGALMTQLTVVSSFGLAWLFLGDAPGPAAIVGSAIVLAGVILASIQR